MLYTIAEVAKATGLEESLILKAIEDGQMTGSKNVSGEWHVQDAELHSFYSSIAQDYCKRQLQADLRKSDGRSQQAESANIADNNEGRVGQEQTETRTGADQAETSPSTPSTASTWQDEIRIDNRDRISASDSRPALRPTRIRFITATVLLALGCSGALSSFYVFGRSQVPEQKANSSGPVLGSEKASIPVTTLEPRSGEEIIGNVASATANAIDHPHESTKNLSQAPSPSQAATEQDTTTSHTAAKKAQTKAVRKLVLVPIPETRPTTLKGWTVRNVVNGIATLEGPGGTWKAARGDTLPGLGKVDSVVWWGNRWIVATSKGLITTP
jgi:hypothetical protein